VLSATSLRSFSSSTLRSTIFLERRFRVHLMSRDRLVYDSRFAPPAKKPSPFVHLYASLRGTTMIASKPPLESSHALVLAETEFDRVLPESRTFRSYGTPAEIVEMRLPAQDLALPVGIDHGPVVLPAAVWSAYHALAAQPSEALLQALIVQLAEARIVSEDLARSVVTQEPERYVRVWSVIEPLYRDLATGASLKQIAVLAGLSLRQLGRDLTDFTRDFGMFGAGFRDAMRILRLRAAVLLLSAPGGSPSEVARAVGYGSLDAMGRAFRDAQLPAPSVVQDAVRFPG
jgi:AraC-like DNA-binding protein